MSRRVALDGMIPEKKSEFFTGVHFFEKIDSFDLHSGMEVVATLPNLPGVSSPTLNKFDFTPKEILGCDLARYFRQWNPTRLAALKRRSGLIGNLRTNIPELLKVGEIEIDSPEFFELSRSLRADGGFVALTDLNAIDFALVICASSQNTSFIRNADGVFMAPSIRSLRIEFCRDLVSGSAFAIAAKLNDAWATKQYGAVPRYVRHHFWPKDYANKVR